MYIADRHGQGRKSQKIQKILGGASPRIFSSIIFLWRQNTKNLIFDPCGANFGKTGVFPKNPVVSVFSPYSALTSCKKSEKTNDAFSRKTAKTSFLTGGKPQKFLSLNNRITETSILENLGGGWDFVMGGSPHQALDPLFSLLWFSLLVYGSLYHYFRLLCSR